MGLNVPERPTFNYVANFTNDPNYKPKSATPDIWNWQQEGVVGPVKDQRAVADHAGLLAWLAISRV